MKKKKIIIYRLGSLGDTVIALPCFHLIREKYPDAHITLLTNKPVASKAAPLEAILGSGGVSYFYDNIINYPVGTRNPFLLLAIILKIRLSGIKTMINITAIRSQKSSDRDTLFFKLAGIKETFGAPKEENDFKSIIDPITGEYEWEAKRLARRLQDLGKINLNNNFYWDLKLTQEEENKALLQLQKIPQNSGIIAICAGTKMQSKDWEIDNWTSLIEKLAVKLPGWVLLMIGAGDEYVLAEQCLAAWNGAGLNLCGKTSPRVSASILQKSELFIGHDSGPMHLAGCVDTPIIAIFSARNLPRQWFPRGNDNQVIYHKTDCAGCRLEVCIEQRKKCILSITVEEVESAVLKSLNVSI